MQLTKTFFFATILLLSQGLKAQFFERIYQNTGITNIGSLDDCSDSGFIVCGTNGNTILMKVKQDGDTDWIINDVGDMKFAGGVIQNSAGNFIVIGGGPAQQYSWLARVNVYDVSGNRLSADSIVPVDGWSTAGISIARSPNRDFYHYWYYSDGYTADNNTFLDNGDVLGGDLTNVNPNCVSISDGGGYVSAGNLLFDMDTSGTWRNNILRLAGNENGVYYFDTDFSTCTITDDGGVMVAGIYDTAGTSYLRLVKIDATGNASADIFIDDTTLTFVYDIKQTADGNYVLLCSGSTGGNHIVFFEIDSLGNLIWKNDYFGNGSSTPVNFRILPDGFVILGTTGGNPYIIRTNNLGSTSTTGLNTAELQHKFKLYPNPSEGMINVISDEVSDDGLLSIFDLVGRNVFITPVTHAHSQINLDFLAKGVYQFRFTANGELKHSGKVVID